MKRLLTLLLALAMILCTFAACGGSDPDPGTTTTAAQELTGEPDTEPVDGSVTDIDETEETSEEASTSVNPDDPTGTSQPSTDNSETTTKAEKVDALKLFNEATKKAVTQKAGYNKTRYTKITDLDFGPLGQFQIVKDAVYGFFDVGSNGEGTLKETVKKGQTSDLLRASTLTANDIKSASAVPDGKGGYKVTLLIKDGNTRWSGEGGSDRGKGTLNSPIDRGPLCYGEDDNSKYDHKTAKNIYLSINSADDALTKDIGERSYNIKAEAHIDSEGRLQKLYGYMEMTVDVHHVKYLIVTLTNKSGSGFGEVTYENFKY